MFGSPTIKLNHLTFKKVYTSILIQSYRSIGVPSIGDSIDDNVALEPWNSWSPVDDMSRRNIIGWFFLQLGESIIRFSGFPVWTLSKVSYAIRIV